MSDPGVTATTEATEPYEPPSRWPTVLGTVAVVYACLGLVLQCIGLFGIFLGPRIQASFMALDPVPVPVPLLVLQSTLCVLGVVLGVMLLLGGIGTLRRRVRGPRLVNLWVYARLSLLLVGVVATFLTLDLNVDYQLEVGKGVEAYLEKNGADPEVIASAVPDRALIRERLVVWPLVFTAMTAVCPVVLGLMLSRRRVREEWQAWS